MLAAWQNETGGCSLYDHFQSGPWHRLASVLADEERETPATIRMAAATSDGRKSIKIIGSSKTMQQKYLIIIIRISPPSCILSLICQSRITTFPQSLRSPALIR